MYQCTTSNWGQDTLSYIDYIFPFQTNIFQRYRKSSHFLTTLPWPLNIIRLVYSSSYRWIILYDSYTFRLLFTLGQKEMLVLPQMWLFDWLEIVVPLNHTYWNQKVIAKMIFCPIRSGLHGHVRPRQETLDGRPGRFMSPLKAWSCKKHCQIIFAWNWSKYWNINWS